MSTMFFIALMFIIMTIQTKQFPVTPISRIMIMIMIGAGMTMKKMLMRLITKMMVTRMMTHIEPDERLLTNVSPSVGA